MIKILIIGDTHFKVNNSDQTNILVDSIIELVIKHKPKLIVFLGDIFDNHSTVNVLQMYRFSYLIKRIKDMAEIYILVGNHDMIDNKQFFPEAHSLVLMDGLNDNITIVNKTKTWNKHGIKLLFVPYLPPGRFVEGLNIIEDWNTYDAIFAHQDFNGACGNSRYKVKKGDGWNENLPMVFNGHIHTPQMIGSKILCPGASIQESFADTPERYVILLKFDDNLKQNIEKIRINSLELKEISLNIRDAYNYTPPSMTKLKIELVGTQAEYKVLSSSGKIKEWQRMGCKVTTNLQSSVDINRINNKKRPVYISYDTCVENELKNDPELFDFYNKNIKSSIQY